MIHRMIYGTLHVGAFRAPWRDDVYHPDRPEKWQANGIVEPAMCSGSGDTSPRHDKSANYDPRCSCCWLNITHTQAKHTGALESHGRCSSRDCWKCRTEEVKGAS